MSKLLNKKSRRIDEEFTPTPFDIQANRDRRDQKRLNRALKTKDVSQFVEEDDLEDEEVDPRIWDDHFWRYVKDEDLEN